MLKKRFWGFVIGRAGKWPITYAPVMGPEIILMDAAGVRIYPTAVLRPYALISNEAQYQNIKWKRRDTGGFLSPEEVVAFLQDGNWTLPGIYVDVTSYGHCPITMAFDFGIPVELASIQSGNITYHNSIMPYNVTIVYSDNGVDWDLLDVSPGLFSVLQNTSLVTFNPSDLLVRGAVASNDMHRFYPYTLDNKGAQQVCLQVTAPGLGGDTAPAGYVRLNRAEFWGAFGNAHRSPTGSLFVFGSDYTNLGGSIGTDYYSLENTLRLDEDYSAIEYRTYGVTERHVLPYSARMGIKLPTKVRGPVSFIRYGSKDNGGPRGVAYRWSNDGSTFHTSGLNFREWSATSTYDWDVSSLGIGVEGSFQYFRLKVTHHGDDGLVQSIAIGKVELSSVVGGPNLCSLGVPSSSSGVAGDAFNGVGWVSGTEDHPWVQYKFLKKTKVSEVRLTLPAAGVLPKGVQVEVSDNGRYWTSVAYFYGYEAVSNVVSLDMSKGLPLVNKDFRYRYLRINSRGQTTDLNRLAYYGRLNLQSLKFRDKDGNVVSPVKVVSKNQLTNYYADDPLLARDGISNLFKDSAAPGDYFNSRSMDGMFLDDRYKKWPESKGAMRVKQLPIRAGQSGGVCWDNQPTYLGFGDFCWELWVYPLTGGKNGSTYSRLVGQGIYGNGGGLCLCCYNTDNPTRISVHHTDSTVGEDLILLSTNTIPNGAWSHVCLERVNGTYTIYINGVADATVSPTLSAPHYITATNFLTFGAATSIPGQGSYFYGYLDLIRLTFGKARYKGAFTPPTSFVTGASDPLWPFVVVCADLNGTQGAVSHKDYKGNLYSFKGNAILSTAQVKEGATSLYLDGVGDYMQLDGHASTNLGTGDFTIEFWVIADEEPHGFSTPDQIMCSIACGDMTKGFDCGTLHIVRRSPDGNGVVGPHMMFNTGTEGSWISTPKDWGIGGAGHITCNLSTHATKWTHVVVQRVSGVFQLYYDGVLLASKAGYLSNVVGARTAYLTMGGGDGQGHTALYSDLRVTVGVARYVYSGTWWPTDNAFTSKFNPPAHYDDVVLHINGLVNMSDTYSCAMLLDELGAVPANIANSLLSENNQSHYASQTASTRHDPKGLYYDIGSAFSATRGLTFTSGFAAGTFDMTPSSVFTVEGYFRAASSVSGQTLYNTGLGGALLHFGTSSTLSYVLGVLNNNLYLWKGSTIIAGPVPYTPATFFHVALVSDGSGTVRMFKDGVFGASGTLDAAAVNGVIGFFGSAAKSGGVGALDGVRFTAAVRYPGTTTFTPGAFPRWLDDPLKSQVKFLQRGVTYDLAWDILENSITDVRCLKKTQLANNSVTVGAGGAFGSGSAYFNGSSSNLWFYPKASQKLSGDFTLETFVFLSGNASGTSFPDDASNWMFIASSGSSLSEGFQLAIGLTKLVFAHAGLPILLVDHGLKLSTWTQIIIQRSGDVFAAYIAGTKVGEVTASVSFADFGSVFRVGSGPSIGYFNGRMNDFRLTNSVRYPSGPGTSTSDVSDSQLPLVAFLATYDATTLPLIGPKGVYANISYGLGAYDSYMIQTTATSGVVYPANPLNSFGTGDFTVEAWMSVQAWNSANDTIVGDTGSAFTTAGNWSLRTRLNSTVGLTFTVRLSNATWLDCFSGFKPAASGFHHVAAVRSGTTIRLFYDGVVVGTFSIGAAEVIGTGGAIGVGRPTTFFGNEGAFNGYIDGVRITRAARFNSSYAVPKIYPPIPGDSFFNSVSLLTRFDGDLESDIGPSFTVTNGSAAYMQGPVGGGAVVCNGSNSYSAPSHAAFNMGTRDFCIEFWLYSAVPWTSQVGSTAILTSTTYGWRFYRDNGYPTKINFRVTDNVYFLSASDVGTQVWEHWACVRSGANILIFKNGQLDAQYVLGAGVNVPDSGVLEIGHGSWGGFLNGAIDGLRITKAARYTNAFSVPSQYPVYEPSTAYDANIGKVLLLSHFDSDTIPVIGPTPVVTGGVTNVAGGVSGNCASFNGTTGFLNYGNDSSFDFGTGDFTIEFWIYCNVSMASMTSPGIIGKKGTDLSYGWQIYKNNSYGTFCLRTAGTVDYQCPYPATQTWEHWAYVRESGVLSIFRNGVSILSESCPYNISDVGTDMYIGKSMVWGGFFNGLLDSVRISTLARYPGGSSFTPPVRYPTSAGMVLTGDYTAHFPQDCSDAFWDSTVLAMHMSNGSYHYDAKGHEMVGYSTNNSMFNGLVAGKYGFGTGLRFSGTYDTTTQVSGFVPKNYADYNFGTGDFEIRFVLRRNVTNGCAIIGNYDVNVEGTWFLGFTDSGRLIFDSVCPDSGGALMSSAIVCSVYESVIVGRKDSYLYMFVSGSLQAAKYDYTANLISSESNPVGLFRRATVSVTTLKTTNGTFNGTGSELESLYVYRKSFWTHPWLPTSRFAEDAVGDPLWSKVEFLCHLDQGDPYSADLFNNCRDVKYGRIPHPQVLGVNNCTPRLDLLLDFGREISFGSASALTPIPETNPLPYFTEGGFSLYYNDKTDFTQFDRQPVTRLYSAYVSTASAYLPTINYSKMGSVVINFIFVAPVDGTYQFRAGKVSSSVQLCVGHTNWEGIYHASHTTGTTPYVTITLKAGDEIPISCRYASVNDKTCYIYVIAPGMAEQWVPKAWMRPMTTLHKASGKLVPSQVFVAGVTTPELKDDWSRATMGTLQFDRHTALTPGSLVSANLNVPRVTSEDGQHRYWRVVTRTINGDNVHTGFQGLHLFERLDGPPLTETAKLVLPNSAEWDQPTASYGTDCSHALNMSSWGQYTAFSVHFDCITPVRVKFLTLARWTNMYSSTEINRYVDTFDIQYSDDAVNWTSCTRMKYPNKPWGDQSSEGMFIFPVMTGGLSDSHVLNEYYSYLESKDVFSAIDCNEENNLGVRKGVLKLNSSAMPTSMVGDIYGTITQIGLPVKRRVVLLDYASMTPVMSVWSDEDGKYLFQGVDRSVSYVVLSQDYAKAYNAVIQDAVTPEEK